MWDGRFAWNFFYKYQEFPGRIISVWRFSEDEVKFQDFPGVTSKFQDIPRSL